jgi:hypothetical protein
VQCFEVILLGEVVYYLKHDTVPVVLGRYKRHLVEDGVFIMRIWDALRHCPSIETIDRHFTILEHFPIPATPRSVIVTFR